MMGLVSWLTSERRDHPSNPSSGLLSSFGYRSTATGATVTETTALQASAVFAAVRVLANGVAGVPLRIMRRRADRGADVAVDFPLHHVLNLVPNEEMTSFALREMLQPWAMLFGNGYAEIVRDTGGRIRELWPLPPWRVRPRRVRAGGPLVYDVTVPLEAGRPTPHTLLPEQVFHLRGPNYAGEGLLGAKTVQLLREVIGGSLATQEYANRFFGNGATPSVVLELPQGYPSEGTTMLLAQFQEKYAGLGRSHRIMMLQDGVKMQQIMSDPEKTQLLQVRSFQVTEVSRIWGVPPHLLSELTHAHYNNVEHSGLDFLMHALSPWYVRWEQQIALDMLLPSERETYFAKFFPQALLRGDLKSRYEAYAIGRDRGWLNGNDIRELEDMNPIPADEGGNAYFAPLNMVPLSTLASGHGRDAGVGDDADEKKSRQAAAADRTRRAAVPVVRATAARVLEAEANAVDRALRQAQGGRDEVKFRAWVDDYYPRQAASAWRRAFAPLAEMVADTYGLAIGAEPRGGADAARTAAAVHALAEEAAQREALASADALRAAMRLGADAVEDAARDLLASWRGGRQDLVLENFIADALRLAARVHSPTAADAA
jgi:HK97 family phage portal protein